MRRNSNPQDRRRGSQLVEAGLMMLPFLALGFMTMDAGWVIFVKATLQHAVREGVRYGVTGQVDGSGHQIASIQDTVVSQSLGLLSNDQVSVQFLNSSNLASTTSNVGGNIVQVSVTDYMVKPIAPLLRSGAGIPVTVTGADLIEGSPGGIPPAP
jgi:Flp pilus assembly protein TadG